MLILIGLGLRINNKQQMELTKRHKSIIHAVFIMLLILQNSAYGRQKSPRIQLNMNTDWAFYRGDIEGRTSGNECHGLDAGNTASYHAVGKETLRRKFHL